MADTRLSDLSAAGALSASDLFYVVQTPGSGGAKATGTQLLTLVGTSYLAKAGGTMTGALTIASGTLAASSPALTITQTWNGAGQRFDTFVMDITNTSSGLSYPVIIRVNGAEQLYLTKSGDLYAQTLRVLTNSGLIAIGADVFIYRDAAYQMALRNGINQTKLSVYNTESASLTNYERLSLTGVQGASVNITAESLGTGAANLDVVITPKGTGVVKFGTHSALAAETVTGYITIKDAGGTTRKLAVIS